MRSKTYFQVNNKTKIHSLEIYSEIEILLKKTTESVSANMIVQHREM